MAYTVLARKYRSRTFEEVIGQKPIATTLVNAIEAGRVHHGYLFTGTRGVGKTSMARILAKSLNCLNADAPTVRPCCECESCLAVAEGQDIDVVEIDAASNTGVDNIRELRSNAAYRPARARFKIYIIDEVHMLSTGAFNALLKTLEEPPEHVKFILATTEIQKVPATIQSRCQRFNFRNIGPDEIAERIAAICRDEEAKVDPAVSRRVARLANGSMRDALSILDQLLAISTGPLSTDVLDEVLPPAQNEQALRLVSRLADGDVPGALTQVEEMLGAGRGLEVLCSDLVEAARALMMIRACGADTELVDIPADQRPALGDLASRFELSQYVQIIAVLEELRRNVRFSGAGRALTDAALVRLAKLREWGAIEELLAGGSPVSSGEDEKKKPRPPVAPVNREPSAGSPADSRSVGGRTRSAVTDPAARRQSAPSASERHNGNPERPAADAYHAEAAAATLQSLQDESPSGFDSSELPSPLAEQLTPVGGAARVRQRTASVEERQRIESDPVVRKAIELFDAKIVNIVVERQTGEADVQADS